jgi:hypothetical protein
VGRDYAAVPPLTAAALDVTVNTTRLA